MGMVAGKMGCLCIALMRSALVFMIGIESGNFFFSFVDAIVILLI